MTSDDYNSGCNYVLNTYTSSMGNLSEIFKWKKSQDFIEI